MVVRRGRPYRAGSPLLRFYDRAGRPFALLFERCFWGDEKPGFWGFSTAHMEKAPISCAFLTSTPFILREMP
jgi:hypothetical protein